MNISNQLTALAADISAVLQREAANRTEWVEIKLDLCRLLAATRAEFPDNTDFGNWLDQKNICISHQDRAAYIAMGADLKQARKVLDATQRRSIRHIYANEWQISVTHVGKTKRGKKKEGVKQAQRSINATPEAWNEFKAKAEAAGKPVAAVLGELVEKAIDPDLPPAAEILSKGAQAKLDAYQRKLERDFALRVEIEARKRFMEWYEDSLKNWQERIIKFEKQLSFRSGVLKATEYKTLMMVCHPDTGAHASDAKRNEAVRILTEHRLKLMAEKEDPFVSKHGLPRTADDLRRAREEVRAANSARSRAAHASRKAKQGATQ